MDIQLLDLFRLRVQLNPHVGSGASRRTSVCSGAEKDSQIYTGGSQRILQNNLQGQVLASVLRMYWHFLSLAPSTLPTLAFTAWFIIKLGGGGWGGDGVGCVINWCLLFVPARCCWPTSLQSLSNIIPLSENVFFGQASNSHYFFFVVKYLLLCSSWRKCQQFPKVDQGRICVAPSMGSFGLFTIFHKHNVQDIWVDSSIIPRIRALQECFGSLHNGYNFPAKRFCEYWTCSYIKEDKST